MRLHTDAGKEFVNNAIKEMTRDMKVYATSTSGYDPRANGRAERYVGVIKQKATSYLVHAKLPLTFWYWAVKRAAYMYRAKALGIEFPSDAPTFGNRVLIRDPKGEEKSFAKKTREGLFLCWDSTVVQGAYVMTTREDGSTTIVATSVPKPWPKSSSIFLAY